MFLGEKNSDASIFTLDPQCLSRFNAGIIHRAAKKIAGS